MGEAEGIFFRYPLGIVCVFNFDLSIRICAWVGMSRYRVVIKDVIILHQMVEATPALNLVDVKIITCSGFCRYYCVKRHICSLFRLPI